jgi:hypothetical protein
VTKYGPFCFLRVWVMALQKPFSKLQGISASWADPLHRGFTHSAMVPFPNFWIMITAKSDALRDGICILKFYFCIPFLLFQFFKPYLNVLLLYPFCFNT